MLELDSLSAGQAVSLSFQEISNDNQYYQTRMLFSQMPASRLPSQSLNEIMSLAVNYLDLATTLT